MVKGLLGTLLDGAFSPHSFCFATRPYASALARELPMACFSSAFKPPFPSHTHSTVAVGGVFCMAGVTPFLCSLLACVLLCCSIKYFQGFKMCHNWNKRKKKKPLGSGWWGRKCQWSANRAGPCDYARVQHLQFHPLHENMHFFFCMIRGSTVWLLFPRISGAKQIYLFVYLFFYPALPPAF